MKTCVSTRSDARTLRDTVKKMIRGLYISSPVRHRKSSRKLNTSSARLTRSARLAWVMTATLILLGAEAFAGVGLLYFGPADEQFRKLLPKELISLIRSAETEFPDRPVEVMVSEVPNGFENRLHPENSRAKFVYLPGHPSFCTANGCRLSLVWRNLNETWVEIFHTESHGRVFRRERILPIDGPYREFLHIGAQLECESIFVGWQDFSMEPQISRGGGCKVRVRNPQDDR